MFWCLFAFGWFGCGFGFPGLFVGGRCVFDDFGVGLVLLAGCCDGCICRCSGVCRTVSVAWSEDFLGSSLLCGVGVI